MATQTEGGKIEFVEYHQPDLADGDYTLTVAQRIEAKQQIPAGCSKKPEAPTTVVQPV